MQRHRILGSLCLATTMLIATPSFAQNAPSEGEYYALVQAGLREFEVHNYQEALAMLLRAYQLRPGGRVLRGIAKTRYELRQYTQTIEDCNAALSATLDPLNPQQRAEVEDLRTRALGYTGTLSIRVTPATADLLIDGRPVDANARAQGIRLNLGSHQVEIAARGYATQRRTVDIAGGGNTQLVVVALVPTGVTGNPLFYISAATGIVSAGGVIAGTLWLLNRNAALTRCQEAIDRGGNCTNGVTLARERDVSLWTLVGSGVLLTASVITFGVLVGTSRAERPPPTVACAPIPNGGFCSMGVRW